MDFFKRLRVRAGEGPLEQVLEVRALYERTGTAEALQELGTDGRRPHCSIYCRLSLSPLGLSFKPFVFMPPCKARHPARWRPSLARRRLSVRPGACYCAMAFVTYGTKRPTRAEIARGR